MSPNSEKGVTTAALVAATVVSDMTVLPSLESRAVVAHAAAAVVVVAVEHVGKYQINISCVNT